MAVYILIFESTFVQNIMCHKSTGDRAPHHYKLYPRAMKFFYRFRLNVFVTSNVYIILMIANVYIGRVHNNAYLCTVLKSLFIFIVLCAIQSDFLFKHTYLRIMASIPLQGPGPTVVFREKILCGAPL